MADLGAKIVKKPDGRLELQWDSDPNAVAYVIDTPSKQGVLAGKSHSTANLGTHDAITVSVESAVRAGNIDTVSWPPVQPSPEQFLHDLRAKGVTSLPYDGRHGPAATGAPLPFTAPNDADHMKAIFRLGDITLHDDAVWEKIFNAHLIQTSDRQTSSHNPWGMHETATEWLQYPNSGELTFQRTHIEGEILWYRQGLLIKPGFVAPRRSEGWCIPTQLCYPSIISPPFGLECNADGIGFDRDYGIVATSADIGKFLKVRGQVPRLTLAYITGKRVHIIIGAKWTTAQDGWIVMKTKVEGEPAWTIDYQATGPTYQLVQQQGLLTGVDEKQGLYAGYQSGTSGAPPVGFETNIGIRGLTIHASEADALAMAA